MFVELTREELKVLWRGMNAYLGTVLYGKMDARLAASRESDTERLELEIEACAELADRFEELLG